VTRSSYGIVEYTPQAYLQSDLNLFYSNLQRQILSGTGPTVDLIDGAIVQTTTQSFSYNGESDLDLQYAIALGRLIRRTTQYLSGSLTKYSIPTKGHAVPNR
jgi:tripeptidyl-peptidase-1